MTKREILFLENDLDKMVDDLERVQKLILEKDRMSQQAREDNRVLTGDISVREQDLRRVKEALEANAQQTQAVTAR